MKSLIELEADLAADALGARLAAVEIAPASAGLAAALRQHRPVPVQRWYRQPRVWGIAAAIALIVTLLFVTPAGASLARALLPLWLEQRVGLVVGAPSQISPQHPGSHGGGHLTTPGLTLAQAQQRVSFHIPTPSWLPPGVSFRGALVDGPQSCLLSYEGPQNHGGLGLAIRTAAANGGPAVPSFAVRPVVVNGQPAVFVAGSYESAGPGAPAVWNSNADGQEVLWTDHGISFDLTASGLRLTLADVLRIADSIP